ncbi:MAG TPA: 16S rRNA (cytosine(1402)-N(4))-methyltransferase RsmH [Kofleriaceae bacterium]
MEFAHESVLMDEVIEGLSPRTGRLYCDGTAGGGGHLARIVATGARAIGIDRDPAAIEATGTRLGPDVRLVHSRYADMPAILAGTQVDGILLDLGVSSPQLDRADRGFSFSKPGPLDMRMDPTRGPTARELIDQLTQDELADVIHELGEERYAKRIARMIKEESPATTTELAALTARAIPMAEQRTSKIHPATRTFQALRIAVNQELDELSAFLASFPDLLAPGGRCAIISFHSLEDRLVKNAFRDLTWTSSLPPKLARDAGERIEPVVELLTKKPIVAGEAEIARNPRARSAKLRVCERTTAPNLPAQGTPR